MRPTILILASHYVPGFKAGGPVRSIANLVENLGETFDFRILCSDRDIGDPGPYPGIARDVWGPVGLAQVHYTSPGLQTLTGLARIIRETPHDLLYLNSFFSPRFTILPLAARRLGLIPSRPLVIAPRGEFSPGAFALKPARKRCYVALAKATGLLADVTWQASSEHEAADLHAALGSHAREVRVATDLPSPMPPTPPRHAPRAPGEPLRIVFVSRISPMKNLDYALEVLSQVAARVSFSVVGPPEDAAYRAACERLAARLPPNVEVCWRGPVDPADVPGVIAEHDLFFLPTRGENFGHVIAEALGAATPVLISDATPWRNLAGMGVGDDLPLEDPAGFVAAIEQAAMTPPDEALARRARVFAYARLRQQEGADIDANRQLFAAALGRTGG